MTLKAHTTTGWFIRASLKLPRDSVFFWPTGTQRNRHLSWMHLKSHLHGMSFDNSCPKTRRPSLRSVDNLHPDQNQIASAATPALMGHFLNCSYVRWRPNFRSFSAHRLLNLRGEWEAVGQRPQAARRLCFGAMVAQEAEND